MIKDLNTLGTGCCDIATKIKEVERNRFLCYNANVTASYTRYGREVHDLEDAVISLIVSIAAGVISHLICKWLDRNK